MDKTEFMMQLDHRNPGAELVDSSIHCTVV